MSRPPGALVSVVVLLGALVAAGTATGGSIPPPPAPESAQVPVLGVSALCADLPQVADEVVTRVSVGAAPAPGVPGDDAGLITAAPLSDPDAAVPLPVDGPGQVVTGLATDVVGDAYAVTARGPIAAGLEVELVTRSSALGDRGLAGLRCEAPQTDVTHLGGATTVGQDAILVLANPDDTAATVDVLVSTSTGPADARPGSGLTVPPRGRLAVALSDLAPDRVSLAVRVVATRGRFASALRHTRVDGRTPLGADYVPQAPPPSREVVVPGLPAGPGGRVVVVSNPGEDDAIVSLEVTTIDGQFVPTGLEAVVVPAGSTLDVDVTTLTDAGPLAVRVTSEEQPVQAVGRVGDLQEGPVRELSYAGAGPALQGPALLTDLTLDQPTESTLLLSALEGDATVVVTPLAVVGQAGPTPLPQTVSVPGGRTVALRLSTFLPEGAAARLAVDVRTTEGSGPVHAARYLRERGSAGPLATILTLRGAAQAVPRPLVQSDPALGAVD